MGNLRVKEVRLQGRQYIVRLNEEEAEPVSSDSGRWFRTLGG